jgi:hypothetical protein
MPVEVVNEKAPDEFRLSRLNIFLFDFNHARRFSGYILRRKLHSVRDPQAVAKLVHLAFNTSLVVAYSRPFLDSNDGAKKKVSLRGAVNAVLDTPEQILHDKIIKKMRNQAFAHSDAASHEIEGFNYDGTTVQIYKLAFEPLPLDETRLLSTMIKKWIEYVEQLRSELKETAHR